MPSSSRVSVFLSRCWSNESPRVPLAAHQPSSVVAAAFTPSVTPLHPSSSPCHFISSAIETGSHSSTRVTPWLPACLSLLATPSPPAHALASALFSISGSHCRTENAACGKVGSRPAGTTCVTSVPLTWALSAQRCSVQCELSFSDWGVCQAGCHASTSAASHGHKHDGGSSAFASITCNNAFTSRAFASSSFPSNSFTHAGTDSPTHAWSLQGPVSGRWPPDSSLPARSSQAPISQGANPSPPRVSLVSPRARFVGGRACGRLFSSSSSSSSSSLSGSGSGRRGGGEGAEGEGGLTHLRAHAGAAAAGEGDALKSSEGEVEAAQRRDDGEVNKAETGGGGEEEAVVIYKGRGIRVLRILVRCGTPFGTLPVAGKALKRGSQCAT